MTVQTSDGQQLQNDYILLSKKSFLQFVSRIIMQSKLLDNILSYATFIYNYKIVNKIFVFL